MSINYYGYPLGVAAQSESRLVLFTKSHPKTPQVLKSDLALFDNHRQYIKAGTLELFTIGDHQMMKVEYAQPLNDDYLIKFLGINTLLINKEFPDFLFPEFQECKFCQGKFYHHTQLDYCKDHMQEVESSKLICTVRSKVVVLPPVVEVSDTQLPIAADDTTPPKEITVNLNLGKPGFYCFIIEFSPKYSPVISYKAN